MERKLEATQETIVDQQQTIEKFRNLVHNLNADLAEYRSKGEKGGEGGADGSAQSQAAMMNINTQLKSAIKTQSRVSSVTCWDKLCHLLGQVLSHVGGKFCRLLA